MKEELLTAEQLREVLDYDPETGEFRWKSNKKGHKSGHIAGNLQRNGYRRIKVDGKKYLAHRLAWLWMTGMWPPNQIDHINGDRSGNRFMNLRLADNTFNMQNQRKAMSNNYSGLLGVWPNHGKWQAGVRVMGKLVHLGTFDCPEKAHHAYLTTKRELHEGNTL